MIRAQWAVCQREGCEGWWGEEEEEEEEGV